VNKQAVAFTIDDTNLRCAWLDIDTRDDEGGGSRVIGTN
jgi:hypothetical protein